MYRDRKTILFLRCLSFFNSLLVTFINVYILDSVIYTFLRTRLVIFYITNLLKLENNITSTIFVIL